MRFRDGLTFEVRNGRQFGCQRLVNNTGVEMLYILTFYLPRFLDLSFQDKLVTVMHELWHVSPKFDGDIRRHPGRCYAHTSSEKDYDAAMEVLARRWLAREPPAEKYKFLELSFSELERGFGRVVGTKVRRPRLIPIG
jgi:hypothetical protein